MKDNPNWNDLNDGKFQAKLFPLHKHYLIIEALLFITLQIQKFLNFI